MAEELREKRVLYGGEKDEEKRGLYKVTDGTKQVGEGENIKGNNRK